ncbi:class III extradiol dioxygenase subunit B-like domain-containing protein [Rhodococcus sp. BP22]|uniref:class III extradiol dioxygenase subunit B-like domain-containing protein n=1 Tax=Rhodococcus sp. BP22 TaxID=2758566 RepID=UPI00164683FB|nr:class III extradiol dioxygenase subunit B-like domain-containing protein [Rhodococcus sp. BP22]
MLSAVAIVPSPPILVPELTGRSVSEALAVRTATIEAGVVLGELADRWIALGVHEKARTIRSDSRGSFAAYGVDVRVAFSPGGVTTEIDPTIPLAALVAGWIRDHSAPDAVVDVHLVGRDTPRESCVSIGRELRKSMGESAEPWGLLVVADGSTMLTAKAPGSFDPRAEEVQNQIDDALANADVGALAGLDRQLCAGVGVEGLAAWQTLAGMVGDGEVRPRTLYRGAPFGVGYFVGTWESL